LRKIPAELCVKCKGYKLLCGLPSCPIMSRFRSLVNVARVLSSKDVITGSTPPSGIVGERGYPNVRVIIGVPPEVSGAKAKEFEDPKGWWGRRSLNEIIELRSSLVSAVIENVKVNDPWKLYEKEISLAVASKDPVQTEVISKSNIVPKLRFDGVLVPRGPSLKAEEVKVDENPKLSKKMESLIFDDVKAEDSIIELYQTGEDVYSIVPSLSMGLLGRRKNRKLVPTRWAITAVDSIIGKRLLRKIQFFPEVNDITVYHSAYLGNRFFVVLFPSKYRGVWVEIWHPMSLWADEVTVVDLYENFWGEYDMLDGGYMAARFSVLEYLYNNVRQAGFVIVREVTKEYFAPVGNWHIRETVRRAMRNPIFKAGSLEEALKEVQSRLLVKVNLFEIPSVKKLVAQKEITGYFTKSDRTDRAV